MNAKERVELWARQDAEWAIEDELIERLGLASWRDIQEENTYRRPHHTLELYCDSKGLAQWRFRPLTATEQRERIEGWIEDNL